MRYDDRQLHSVTLGMLNLENTDHGPMAGVAVSINVTSRDGTQLGPGLDAQIGFPVSSTSSLEEIRDQALQAAYEMVQRISRESLDDLRAAYDKTPWFQMLKDKA